MKKEMIHGMVKWFFLISSLLIFLCPFPVLAQREYPNRPITLIEGGSLGGNTDLGLRMLAESASKIIGQPIIVENKLGTGGFKAFVETMNAKPDGYTIGHQSTMMYDRSVMFEKVPRKVEDASMIGCYWTIVNGLAVRADAPWKTFKEFVEYTRTHPGEITYGVPDVGSPPHLAMGLIGKKEKINWKTVPFKGLADCIPALLGGHITSIAGLGGAHLDQVRAGKMRLLVIYGSGRLPSFPNIPTLIDEGYGFSIAFDNGLVGPKGIDPAVLKKLEDVFTTAAKDPKFQTFVKDNDMILTYMNGTQYVQFLKQNYELRVPLLQEIGLAFK